MRASIMVKRPLQWLISIAGNGDFKGHINVADLEKTRQLSGTVDIDNPDIRSD